MAESSKRFIVKEKRPERKREREQHKEREEERGHVIEGGNKSSSQTHKNQINERDWIEEDTHIQINQMPEIENKRCLNLTQRVW